MYSNLFVCLMGMGITFLGLTCIIYLTRLLGVVMRMLDKRRPKEAPPQGTVADVPLNRAPGIPADGIASEVKVAIIASLMQTPGFRMDEVTNIVIRRRT